MSDASSHPLWRRKTDEERRAGHPRAFRRRLNPAIPLMAGGFCGTAAWLLALIAALPFLDTGQAVIWCAVNGIVFGFVCTLLIYLMQFIGVIQPPSRLRMGICNRCFKLTLDGRLETCDCGGTFEDADGWTLNRCPQCGTSIRPASLL